MRGNAWVGGFLLAGVLLLGVGCGRGAMQHTGVNDQASGDFDVQFIDMMVPHHQGAVAMAETALDRGERREIKQLADAVISAQTGEIAQLKGWQQAWVGSDQTAPLERMPMVPGMSGHGEHGTMDMVADV